MQRLFLIFNSFTIALSFLSAFYVILANDERLYYNDAKRQVWQRMILRIVRPKLISVSIWQKAFWLFAII